MEQILLVLHVIIAAALIGMVLLQRSDTDGFGLGSGGSNLLSGRATANLMTRTTAILAALFILNSLILSVLAAHRHGPSVIETLENEQIKNELSAPAVPLAGADKKAKVDAKESKTGLAPVEKTIAPEGETKPVKKAKAKPVETDEESEE